MNNMISDGSLMSNFNFSNYHPFPFLFSSSSSQPYTDFLNHARFHGAKHGQDSSSVLVSDVEALPMADVAAVIGSNGIFKGKPLESSRDSKEKGVKVKKPRHVFQTRSQVTVLDDGYRWRKYGQKAVKNNKFPRSYYRCTHQGCNVKKQVQRLTKDEAIVETTYVGVHSHSIQESTETFEHILSQLHIYGNGTTSY